MFESTEPTPAPIEQPRAVVRPTAPRRERAWPLIVATIIAGVGGIAAAWYFTTTSDRDAPAFAMPVMTLPAPPPVAPAAVAPAVVEPAAPIAVEPAAAPPTVEPQPVAAPPHRGHAKPKRIAKHAKPAAAPATTTEHVKAATPPAPVTPTPTAPARATRQAMDKENPL